MLERAKHLIKSLLPAPVRRKRVLAFFEREIAGAGERELAWLGQWVSEGDNCLDVGANMGLYSYALNKIGARVTAFEPNPQMVAMLKSLDLSNLTVREIALSDTNGEATFGVPDDGDLHACGTLEESIVGSGEATTFTVQTRRLDDLDLKDIAFIKVDVEGHEESMLEGALETIEREQPVLLMEIEERHNVGGLKRICERLMKRDYTPLYLRDESWHPVSTFDASRDQVPDGKTVPYINNFLFLPAGRTAGALA